MLSGTKPFRSWNIGAVPPSHRIMSHPIDLAQVSELYSQWKRRWLSDHAAKVRIPSIVVCKLVEKSILVFTIRDKYINF